MLHCTKFGRWIFNFVNLFFAISNYLPLEKGMALHLNKFQYPSPKDGLCQVLLKLAQWFWRRRFLNFVNVFSLFRNYLYLEKDSALHFPFTQECNMRSLVEIGPMVPEKKIFFNFFDVFSLFRHYLPTKRAGSIIWTNLSPHHPMMHCAKFGWNWPSGSGEDFF